MFKWISNLFKPTPDKIEERLLSLFDFLLNTYGFSYSKEELGNEVKQIHHIAAGDASFKIHTP